MTKSSFSSLILSIPVPILRAWRSGYRCRPCHICHSVGTKSFKAHICWLQSLTGSILWTFQTLNVPETRMDSQGLPDIVIDPCMRSCMPCSRGTWANHGLQARVTCQLYIRFGPCIVASYLEAPTRVRNEQFNRTELFRSAIIGLN